MVCKDGFSAKKLYSAMIRGKYDKWGKTLSNLLWKGVVIFILVEQNVGVVKVCNPF